MATPAAFVQLAILLYASHISLQTTDPGNSRTKNSICIEHTTISIQFALNIPAVMCRRIIGFSVRRSRWATKNKRRSTGALRCIQVIPSTWSITVMRILFCVYCRYIVPKDRFQRFRDFLWANDRGCTSCTPWTMLHLFPFDNYTYTVEMGNSDSGSSDLAVEVHNGSSTLPSAGHYSTPPALLRGCNWPNRIMFHPMDSHLPLPFPWSAEGLILLLNRTLWGQSIGIPPEEFKFAILYSTNV